MRIRESKSAEQHRRRCVPIYHMHMLLVLSDVSSFLVTVRVTWTKATITLFYPSLVFLPFKDMGSTVEIDIHLTVQLASKVRATPFIGYQYQSTRMLSSCRVSVERVSRPYFSIGVEREGAFLSFVTKRVNLNCLPLREF